MNNQSNSPLKEIIRRTNLGLSTSPLMSAHHIRRFCDASILNATGAIDGASSLYTRTLTKVLEFEMPDVSPRRATFGDVAMHIASVLSKSCPSTELIKPLTAFYFRCFDLSVELSDQGECGFANRPEMKDLAAVYRFLKSTPYADYDEFMADCEAKHAKVSGNRRNILCETGLNFGEIPMLKLYSALKDVQFHRRPEELDELDEEEVNFSPIGNGFSPELEKYGILLLFFVYPVAHVHLKMLKDRSDAAKAKNQKANKQTVKQQKGD